MVTFEQPFLLFLLLPVGILIYWTWKRMSLPYSSPQRRLILVSRITLFSLIILALAGIGWTQPVSRQTTVFVGDISASTGPQRTYIEQWINNALKHKHPTDQVGIVAVGRNALVEQSINSQLNFSRFESAPDTNYTDLAAGLRLAAALLPQDSQRHIILLSDGQQNLEDALPEAQLLRQDGIRLDVVELPTVNGSEARINDLQAPTNLHTDERFVLHAKVYSSVAQNAKLRIYMDSTLLSEQSVQLNVGEQDESFSLTAPASGFHTFRMTLEAPNDTIVQNNEASALVNVQGPPVILIVEGQPDSGKNIAAALKATGMQTEITSPDNVPTSLDGLVKYSSIVLADVPAVSLGTTRMQTIQTFVRDLGHGLIVSGGENSYGLGGYSDTPLEQTLPVRMDIPQHKETPSIAVVLIIESLESEIPINISKEAAKGVVGFLTPRDMVGVSGGYGTLTVNMQAVTDRSKIDKQIDNLNPTDPASYTPDLLNAEKTLLPLNAQIKHIILLGDGDAFDPTYNATAAKIANEGITISTVATNSMSSQELGTMQQIAQAGKGRFYQADNPATIPQILLQETQHAARRSIINETFQPAIVGNHPIMTGLSGVPQLNGYVATTPKSTAQIIAISHLDDPVLAVWQYGLGRVVAWTSDALGLWTKDWLAWNNAARWWANLTTWTLPSASNNILAVSGKMVNGSGQLIVELNSAVPVEATQQQVQAHIVGPAPDNVQQDITLQPTAPERWEGSFTTTQIGGYVIQVTWQASSNGANGKNSGTTDKLITEAGLVVPYSPEYHTQGTDNRLLKLLANAGGGSILKEVGATFDQVLAPASSSVSIAFWLLLLAALLLPVDVALRRLTGLDALKEGYGWLQERFKPGTTRLAATVEQLPVPAPTVSVLGHLRSRREEKKEQYSTSSKGKSSKTLADATAHLKTPPAMNNIKSVASNQTLANQPAEQRTKPQTQTNQSTTARLLEAKRKRKDK